MRDSFASLLIPELRWDSGFGFDHLSASIDDALGIGVGGFLITGGTRDSVAALTRELHRRSRHPLLICSDAESGAGEQIEGLTGLPPVGALAALRDGDVIRRAARLTARELRAVGVNWALAPVGDLAINPQNTTIGSRSFGSDAQRAAEWVVEWIDTCQAEGVLACIKHFPGVGRAAGDTRLSVAHVDASAAELWGNDLLPFRGGIEGGVASVMASHVIFPRLDDSGSTVARSRPILTEFLRGELKFDGLIVSDAVSVPGAHFGTDEFSAAVEAISAGCDMLLCPSDPVGLVEQLETAVERGQVPISLDDVEESQRRREFWANWALPRGGGMEPTLDDVLWARQVADTLVHPVRGAVQNIGGDVDVIHIEDDLDSERGWRSPVVSRGHFIATLRALGVSARELDYPSEGTSAIVVPVFGEPSPGRGRWGYSEKTRRKVAELAAAGRKMQRSVIALIFGHPQLSDQIPEVSNVMCCWSGDKAMQEAAARKMVR